MDPSIDVMIVKGVNSQFDELLPTPKIPNMKLTWLSASAEVVPYLTRHQPEIVLMDLLIDQKDALDILNEIRQLQLKKNMTVVVFSSRKENYVQITALNAGADDFLVKPVNKRVFESRFNAWIRRSPKFLPKKDEITRGSVILNRERFSLQSNGEEVMLQKREFEIISLLISRPKKVFSREEIKQVIWGSRAKIRNRTIDVHIRNLRIKVGVSHIKTYKGIGYSFDPKA